MITVDEKIIDARKVLVDLSKGDNPLSFDEDKDLSVALSCASKMQFALKKIIQISSEQEVISIAQKALIAQI